MFLIKREVDAYEENDLIEIIDSSEDAEDLKDIIRKDYPNSFENSNVFIADSCLDAYRSYEIVEKI